MTECAHLIVSTVEGPVVVVGVGADKLVEGGERDGAGGHDGVA